LAALLVVSMQLPLQLVVEPEQDDEHEPELQTWAAAHAFEQLPQWSWLDASTMQVDPPHVSEPAAHPHCPFTQAWPDAQLVPQAPQCCALVLRSKHP
jgi:hypothetical protein